MDPIEPRERSARPGAGPSEPGAGASLVGVDGWLVRHRPSAAGTVASGPPHEEGAGGAISPGAFSLWETQGLLCERDNTSGEISTPRGGEPAAAGSGETDFTCGAPAPPAGSTWNAASMMIAMLPDAPWTWLQYGGPAIM